MIVRPLSRRAVLRGAGGVVLALPLLEAMLPRKATAAERTVPPRVIFFMTGCGFHLPTWQCKNVSTDGRKFTLSKVLAPLEPIREHCLFIEGVPMSASNDPEQKAVSHDAGTTSALTGHWAGEGPFEHIGAHYGYALSESIDYTLGQGVGKNSKFPVYRFGVIPERPTVHSTPFYTGKDKPVAPNANPYAVAEELFGDFKPSAGTVDAAAAARRRRDRGAVLDAVADELRSLKCQLGSADRQRLDQHATMVEEIQRRLATNVAGGAACKLPSVGDPIDVANPDNMPALGKLQMDLLSTALACNLTRVAGLQWHAPANPRTSMVYRWLGKDITLHHHDISHFRGVDPAGQLGRIGAWHSEQLLHLVQTLQAMPEADGSVFDNTVIYWFSELGNGDAHTRHDSVFTIVGGKNYFDSGRYLKFDGTDKSAHNRLLLHLLHYMGMEVPVFGAAKYCAGGPLQNIRV